jgi:hypothetical protein
MGVPSLRELHGKLCAARGAYKWNGDHFEHSGDASGGGRRAPKREV